MEDSVSHSTPFEIIGAVSGMVGFKYGYYRIITGSIIKYLAFLDPNPTFPDIRGERLDFTTIPEGDWNVGYLIHKATSNKFTLDSTEKTILQGIWNIWHPSTVDYFALGEASSGEGELQCLGQIYSAVYHNHFDNDKVIVNYEWYPDCIYGVTHETEIYSLIQGRDIGPNFLAHITENHSRVIGYMVEKVLGRHATISDLQACQEVLSKLHSLGIVYGSLSPSSFLIADGHALLYGFGGSYRTDDQSVLDAEMAGLEDILRRGWHPDKPLSQALSDEILAISQRDNGIHPAVIDQATREGKITITEVEHRKLLLELQKDGGLFKVSH